MGIPILAEIERLITEHGSAAILKERLALASDQYAALEKKILESNLRTEQLQFEKDSLLLDLEKAHQKIWALEEKLSHTYNPFKFDDKTGTFISSADGMRYCAKCKSKNNLSPLKNSSYGWECPVCEAKFSDPLRPRPTSIPLVRS